ncbi:DUF1826 domain-containing protein [Cochlodiniinecator piscidefendens]|uniref:DUF1826 domain-containing protein n=1 Tax=Cochlodiniinecator piscidefendens TaxID=2715756 RepID=UPI00140D1F09|nr:DUF1826 domain-containing protein [Cochlodiniinecator piscidefendens]
MNAISNLADATTISVQNVDTPNALSAFLNPACAAAIWNKHTPAHIQSGLNNLRPEQLPRGRITLRSELAAEAVTHLCDIAEMPSGPERDWLESDIAALATLFSELLNTKYLRLRLDVVTTNACRKFHIDALTARLVCTYRGTGTQYGFAQAGNDPKRIITVDTGAPILLRGTLWPEKPASGLLHRSPPIEGTNETRLVLVLDPVLDPEGDA